MPALTSTSKTEIPSSKMGHEAALLVHAGADPNARDVYGWTALHLAAGRGNKRVAEALMQAGADPSLRDDEGKTPADLAANALVRKAIMNGSCQA